jgi:hypothetical protein
MRRLILLLGLFLTLGTQAQLMDWGNPQKLASRNFYCHFVGFNADGYYYLRCKKPDFKNEVTIEKYSRSLNLAWSKSISTLRFTETLVEAFLLKNKIIVISSEENYSNGFTELKATSITFDGEISGAAENLIQVKTSALYEESDERFKFNTDEKGSMFSVCYVTQSDKKYASLNYNLFNDAFQNVGSGGYPYTSRTEQFFINSILFRDYKLYCLVSYGESGKKSSDDIYQHDVVLVNNTLKTFTKIPVVLEGKIQSDLGMYVDTARNTLQLAGFYSEKKSLSAAGVVVYNLPLENPESYSAAFTPFPKELLSKIIGERGSERTKEVEDFVVNRIVPRSDGGLVIVAECFYIEKQPYNNYTSGIQGITPQPTIFRNVYNYDEVLLLSLDSAATLDWWQVITKNQNSINDDGYNLSIATLVKKDMIYVFYNMNYHNSNEILEYKVSSNGTMKNKILFKSTNYYIDFTPRQCAQVAAGSLLLPMIKDRKFNLLKLTY